MHLCEPPSACALRESGRVRPRGGFDPQPTRKRQGRQALKGVMRHKDGHLYVRCQSLRCPARSGPTKNWSPVSSLWARFDPSRGPELDTLRGAPRRPLACCVMYLQATSGWQEEAWCGRNPSAAVSSPFSPCAVGCVMMVPINKLVLPFQGYRSVQ